MIFDRHYLFSIFSVLFFLVTISPFFERLAILGSPNLSLVRMGIAIILLILTMPFLLQRGIRFNVKILSITIMLYILILYIIIAASVYQDKFVEITFYIVYIHLVFFGYLAIFPDNLERFEKLINVLCIIAVSVGLAMTIAGPDKLLAIGIGAIEGKWGQFTFTDAQPTTGVDVSLFFRSFSVFMDHQAFSVFLQLSAFFYRFLYEIKKNKKYVWYIALLLVSNTMTFSTTGFLVIVLILVSFIKFRYFLIFIPCIVFLGLYLYAAIPQLILLVFHIGSLQMRMEFIQNALQIIRMLPSLHEMGRVNFSADCYLLWMAYKYGMLYAILQLTLLLFFIIFFAFNRKTNPLPAFLLTMVFFINILSNGVCFSTPNNIFLPVLFGMVTAYSLQILPKEKIT